MMNSIISLYKEEQWYKDTLAKSSSLHTFRMDEHNGYIYLAKTIKNEKKEKRFSQDILGVSLVGIDITQILQQMEKLKATDSMKIAVLDENNKIICKSQNMAGDDFITEVAEKNPVAIDISNEFSYGGFLINMVKTDIGISFISFIPMSDIYLQTREIRGIFLLSILIAGLMIIFMSLVLSYNLTNPIKRLSSAMLNAKEDEIASLHIKVPSKDEVGDLYYAFNKLITKVSNLMKKMEAQNIATKELEMKMFQLQINPHFLYNTLDSISWIALMNSQYDIVDMIKCLSEIFRYSVKDGNTLANIEDEVACVKNYIRLQQKRYENVFDLEINIPEEYKTVRIPKCIFQPLVENSIIHGRGNTEIDISIKISAKRLGDNLEIHIEDNGLGCDVDKLNKFLSGENDILPNEKMGIKNVNERIRLTYGELYGLRYAKSDSGGTIAIITIAPQ